MFLVKPSFELLSPKADDKLGWFSILDRIEVAGRTCYRSEKRNPDDNREFTGKIIKHGIEHAFVSVRFIIDQGTAHELVAKHKLASYSQESTRYCDYMGKRVVFVIPPWTGLVEGLYSKPEDFAICEPTNSATHRWLGAMEQAELAYQKLRSKGWSPQQAQSVLPNSLKTQVICTANLREWKNIFKSQTAKAAHPQMREVMVPLLRGLQGFLPVIFSDIEVDDET